MIANLEETPDCKGNWIKASVAPDGKFTIVNGRNGFSKTCTAVSSACLRRDQLISTAARLIPAVPGRPQVTTTPFLEIGTTGAAATPLIPAIRRPTWSTA